MHQLEDKVEKMENWYLSEFETVFINSLYFY